ncbi:MAG TPA: class I tRNA ligase family protein, partial [Thermoanaerobaculia bacterium]|nr:class I tRNA ligase family protein [Thermoanaerobaculia bacterium]
MATYYLTTPIYYVNGLPHIGHIFTTTVGDTLIRYRRMAGDETYFLTGTDEHGQNIERAARKEG